MGLVLMMRVMSSTSSPAVAGCSTWMGTHLFFGHIILFSGAFGGSRFPQGDTISQFKNYYFLLCHGNTLGELVNTPWTHHVLHLFLFSGIPSPRVI